MRSFPVNKVNDVALLPNGRGLSSAWKRGIIQGLGANRVGVKKMLLTEYNEAGTMELFSLGRAADAERAATDEHYRDRMFEELGID